MAETQILAILAVAGLVTALVMILAPDIAALVKRWRRDRT